MENYINFTIYHPYKEDFEKWLDDVGIPFKNTQQSLILSYIIQPQYKMVVREHILNNGLQDRMAVEFRWLGWKNWVDGDAERKDLNYDKMAH